MILPSAREGSYLQTGTRKWKRALIKESSFSYSSVRPVAWKSRALTKGHHLLFLSFEQPLSAADGLFPALIPILTPLLCRMECSANSKRRNKGGGRGCLYEHHSFREGESEKMASWMSLFLEIPVISLVSPVSFFPPHHLLSSVLTHTHTHTHSETHTPSAFLRVCEGMFFKGTKQRTCGNGAGLVVWVVMSVRGQSLIPTH